MDSIIKGIVLGFVILMPGISGGTAFLIFGLYEKMVKDLSKFNFKPYITLSVGIIIGIFISGFALASFFVNYRDFTVAFLLGCLLASVKPVLQECPQIKKGSLLLILIGTAFGWSMAQKPLGTAVASLELDWWLLLFGGFVSSTAMIIPGISGSSLLILLGIYDSIMFSIKNLSVINLSIFGLGNIVGILLLFNLLSKLYEKYKGLLSSFFAGLILGSTRSVIPSVFNQWTIALAVIGFMLVWIYSSKNGKCIN